MPSDKDVKERFLTIEIPLQACKTVVVLIVLP